MLLLYYPFVKTYYHTFRYQIIPSAHATHKIDFIRKYFHNRNDGDSRPPIYDLFSDLFDDHVVVCKFSSSFKALLDKIKVLLDKHLFEILPQAVPEL